MKRLISFVAAALAHVALADPAVPPPPTIIINYGSYQTQGQIVPAGSPAPQVIGPVATAEPPAAQKAHFDHFALPENEPEGLSLGGTFGILDVKGGSTTAMAGGLARLRFFKFLSLEAEGALGLNKVTGADSGPAKPHSVSVQAMAQITFHSILFDLTPKAGAGYTDLKQGRYKYSGHHLTLGSEVSFGVLKVMGEIRIGNRMTALGADPDRTIYYNVDPDIVDTWYYPGYGTSTYTYVPEYNEGRLGAAFQVGERSRVGFTYSSNPAASHAGGYLQLGL